MRNDNRAKTLRVDVLWDDEAGVWCASSTDIAGLALEAATKDALVKRLKIVIPELLELNHARPARTEPGELPVELTISGRKFTVDGRIRSRHTANETLKQAGLPKAF